MTSEVITVGLDASEEALAAALWGAREAQLRNATLHLMHAWILLASEPEGAPLRAEDQNYWARWIVDRASERVLDRYPDLSVSEELVPEEPAAALLRAAWESDLLVLGSRDMAPVASYLLGDIGLRVVTRVQAPLVLVRPDDGGRPAHDQGDVVLGLSLHGPCDGLVSFACGTATRWRVALRVVHGRSLPAPAYTRGGVDPAMSAAVAEDARTELTAFLRPWRERFPDLPMTTAVTADGPARAVLRTAADAGLLVLGRRRRRPALSPPVGHVLQAAMHHAACPVAVVPHD
ncbi:universal stress protein [Streptomyces hebeiensis]